MKYVNGQNSERKLENSNKSLFKVITFGRVIRKKWFFYLGKALRVNDACLVLQTGSIVTFLQEIWWKPCNPISFPVWLLLFPGVEFILEVGDFHGVFTPHCKYRSLIIPQSVLIDKTSPKEQEKAKKSYAMGWTKILKRVFCFRHSSLS